MNQHLNPKAVKKAMQAADHLAKAARLMREAAYISDDTALSGRYDFTHWADQIEHLISSDNGEAGVRPTMAKIGRQVAPNAGMKVKTYPHRRSDGRVVNVTVPEKEERP